MKVNLDWYTEAFDRASDAISYADNSDPEDVIDAVENTIAELTKIHKKLILLKTKAEAILEGS